MPGSPLVELGAAAASVAAADRAGLFALLREAPATVADAAKSLDVDAGTLGLFVDVLLSRGFLTRDAGGELHLGAPLLQGPMALLDKPGALVARWFGAERLLREGPGAASAVSLEDRDRAYRSAVPRLAQMFAAAAESLAAEVCPSLPRDAKLLDVGAGAGTWGLAMLARISEAHLTGVDLPGVVPRLLEAAEARSLASRVTGLASDYFEVSLEPGGFNLIVLGAVLHLEPPTRAQALLRRLRPALAPGGSLMIVDMFGDETPAHRQAVAAYGVHLALRVAHARAHSRIEVTTWLRNLGLEVQPPLDLSPAGPLGLGALIGRG